MRMWPSERGWARRSPGVSSGSQLPSAPLPRSLKVRSIMDLRGEGRRPGRAVSNSPAGFKEMLDMAGEHPSSLTGAGCAQGGATLGSVFINRYGGLCSPSFLCVILPMQESSSFCTQGKGRKKPTSHRDLTQLPWSRSIPASNQTAQFLLTVPGHKSWPRSRSKSSHSYNAIRFSQFLRVNSGRSTWLLRHSLFLWRCPCSVQGCGTRWPLKVPSSPVILWSKDSAELLSCHGQVRLATRV